MKNKRIEKLIFGLWIVLALSSVGFSGLVLGAWATTYLLSGGQRLSKVQSNIILGLASIPYKVKVLPKTIENIFVNDPLPLLLDRKSVEEKYWLRQFPSSGDTGYVTTPKVLVQAGSIG